MNLKVVYGALIIGVPLCAMDKQNPSTQSWDAKKFYKATKQSLPLAKALLDAYPLKLYHSILDLGCGPGSLTAHMAKKAGNQTSVTGIDPSKNMIAFAQGYYQRINLAFEHNALPQSKNKWDFIFCCNVFPYLPRQQQVDALNVMAQAAVQSKTVPLLLITAAKTNEPGIFDRAYAATLGLERWQKLRSVKLDEYYCPHDVDSFIELAKETPWKVNRCTIEDEYIQFKNVNRLKKFVYSWMSGFAFIAQLPKRERKLLLKDLMNAYVALQAPAPDGSIEWRSARLIVHAEKQKVH